jgi:hypothetical protein
MMLFEAPWAKASSEQIGLSEKPGRIQYDSYEAGIISFFLIQLSFFYL